MQNLKSWASVLFFSIVAQFQTFLFCGLACGLAVGIYATVKLRNDELLSGKIGDAFGYPDTPSGISLEQWDGLYRAAMATDVRATVQELPILGWCIAAGFALGAVVFFLILIGATVYHLRRLSSMPQRLLEQIGAKPFASLSIADELNLVPDVVHDLAKSFDVPAPAVYGLQDEEGINAFVLGCRKSESTLVVTRGMRHLNETQMRGLIAQQMSVLSNGDMIHNMRLLALGFGVNCVLHTAEGLFRSGRRLLSGSASNQRSAILNVPWGSMIVLLGVVLWPIGKVTSLAGAASMARSNRRRTLRSDRLATTRLKSGEPIGSALKRVMGYHQSGNIKGAECRKLGHLMFAQAVGSTGRSLSSHPKLEDRIRRVDQTWDGTPIYENSDETSNDITGAEQSFAALSQHVDLKRVESALSNVDAAAVNVFRSADAAMVTIPALLLMDPRHRPIASSMLNATLAEPVEMLWECIESIDPKERFALTELTSNATKDLDSPAVDGLLQKISDQLPSGAWSAWFWTQVFIETIGDDRVPARVTLKNCRKRVQELATILSLGASLDTNTDSACNMRELQFQRLWMSTGLKLVDYIPCEKIRPIDLTRATKKLSHLPKEHLNIILKRMVESFESHDSMNPDQGAFLRYLTARWDTTTPEPPFIMISKTVGEAQLSFRRC